MGRDVGTGALYDVVALTKNMAKPAGEWNRVRITCKGKHIQVNLNGEDIMDYDGIAPPTVTLASKITTENAW